jgi:hypothetical protein
MKRDPDEALDGDGLTRRGTARDHRIINPADGASIKVYLASARPLQSPVKLTRPFARLCIGSTDQTKTSCRILVKVPLEAQPLAALGAEIGSGAVLDFIRTNAQSSDTAAEGSNGPLQPGMPPPPAAQASAGAPGVLVTVANLGDSLLYRSKDDWYVSTAKKERTAGGLAHLNGWRLVTLEAIREQVDLAYMTHGLSSSSQGAASYANFAFLLLKTLLNNKIVMLLF